VNSGWPSDIDNLVTVQVREAAREFTLIDRDSILGLARSIREGDWRSLVNRHIDLMTFNVIY